MPALAPAQVSARAPPPAQTTAPTSSSNPFMNMTFTPFVPSHLSLFSAPVTAGQLFPNLWTSNIPDQHKPAQSHGSGSAASAATTAAPGLVPAPEPEFIEIRENIQHINDLIALCDKYPLSDTKKYNINMSAIHAIRQPLCDLSNMIGMDTIKKTIVDQILYYLQELHIPETKISVDKDNIKDDDKENHLQKGLETGTKPDINKAIFNPFTPIPPFPGFPAGATVTAEFKPLSSKFPPWTPPGGASDDFALPTKGDFMHTVIYGPPGSGKTEVAKIIGRIFSNLGILNKKIFKKVSRNDLVAGYLGQTAIKTKDMIKASLGGVLFIDEAYSLGNSEKRDSFAKECVDTLCEALSEHKHNWMVIIAGYEKELHECFFSLNEGLNSRFTWRFKLDAYKPGELKSIYEKQVRDYGWTIATGSSSGLLESWFASRMDYFTTYGRDMETLFTKTKIAHSRRVFCLPVSEKKIITIDDLENGFKLFIENPEVKDRKDRGIGPYMKTLYL
jgi:nicotinamide riboside kinase